MKTLMLMIGVVVLLLAPITHAREVVYTSGPTYNFNYYTYGEAEDEEFSKELSNYETDISRAIAATLAATGCQFDYSKAWQGCVAGSYFNDESGISFQAGKRVDDILFNGGLACDTEFRQCAGVGAINWHF